MSTQMGFGLLLNELGRGDSDFVEAHRHDGARRDGLDQSRAVGEPARPVRTREDGRHVQERAHRLHLPLGIRTEGPAHRARHRRDEPVHPALGARPVAFDQRRAAVSDRHAVRSVHRARPRCAQLRLLPGGALHPGGDALRHHACGRRRRASVDRHAADRHGAGRARGIRTRLRRRARHHHGVVFRLHPERPGHRRGGAVGAQLAARRDRRLGVPAAFHAPDRSDQAHARRRHAPRDHRRRLLDAKARAELPGGRRLHRRGRAGSDRGRSD